MWSFAKLVSTSTNMYFEPVLFKELLNQLKIDDLPKELFTPVDSTTTLSDDTYNILKWCLYRCDAACYNENDFLDNISSDNDMSSVICFLLSHREKGLITTIENLKKKFPHLI